MWGKQYVHVHISKTNLVWCNTRIRTSLKLESIDLDTATQRHMRGTKIQKSNLKRKIAAAQMGYRTGKTNLFLGHFVDFRYWNKTNLKRGKLKYTSRETRSNLIPIDRAARGDLPRGRESLICGTLDSRSRLLTSKDLNPQPLHHCSNKNQPSALDWWSCKWIEEHKQEHGKDAIWNCKYIWSKSELKRFKL